MGYDNKKKSDFVLILKETEAKNGGQSYFKGSIDMGNGKMISFTTFGAFESKKGNNVIVCEGKKWKSTKNTNRSW